MIHYLTTERNAPLMQGFLATWGRAFARRIAIVPYERLLGKRDIRLARGAYIFTSIGHSLGSRNPPSPARQWATRLHAALVEHCGPDRVLNHPVTSLRRFDLLRLLADQGVNRFRAWRADGPNPGMRFPVFLRPELGTVWEAPPLAEDHDAYEALRAQAKAPGLMAIEFCRTADAGGVFRKYGAFVVGGRIVPRHLFLSRNWLVKAADIADDPAIREELAFVEGNPHEQLLLKVCRMANIGYGRIDYAVLDGAPQIWEINTTPQIVSPPAEDPPARKAVHARFTAAFCAALDALDPESA